MTEHTGRRYRTPAEEYEHQRELAQKRAAWEEQRRRDKEQEQRDRKRAELESYLRERAQEWADTTGSAPPISVTERWQAEYMDEKELVRRAERAERLARAEAAYDF